MHSQTEAMIREDKHVNIERHRESEKFRNKDIDKDRKQIQIETKTETEPQTWIETATEVVARERTRAGTDDRNNLSR